MGCVAFVACVTPHTKRVSLMHSVVCIVYVERNVQTRHIPFDTPASEVFSRPSTQMLPKQRVENSAMKRGHNNASKTAR